MWVETQRAQVFGTIDLLKQGRRCMQKKEAKKMEKGGLMSEKHVYQATRRAEVLVDAMAEDV